MARQSLVAISLDFRIDLRLREEKPVRNPRCVAVHESFRYMASDMGCSWKECNSVQFDDEEMTETLINISTVVNSSYPASLKLDCTLWPPPIWAISSTSHDSLLHFIIRVLSLASRLTQRLKTAKTRRIKRHNHFLH
jgi:hypothetical protein